jgi:alpha-galactosidase
LGDVKARDWIKDRIQNLIQEGGIDVYRQDHNFPPLSMWRANDGPNRQGMTENLYIQGYLRFWDELLLENPGLWIDSCASGGRRNDLETLRRSVPLHYTDYGYGDHAVKLAFQRTMFEWIPYFKEFTLSWDVGQPGRWNHCEDSFGFHCAMAPMLFPTFDIKRDDYDFDLDLIQKMICVWRRVANFVLYGDYYALTPYHRSPKKWVARQFDRPEQGCGLVQAIRLQECEDPLLTATLHAMDRHAIYRLEDPENGKAYEASGSELADEGVAFRLEKRQGQIWTYRKLEP